MLLLLVDMILQSLEKGQFNQLVVYPIHIWKKYDIHIFFLLYKVSPLFSALKETILNSCSKVYFFKEFQQPKQLKIKDTYSILRAEGNCKQERQ